MLADAAGILAARLPLRLGQEIIQELPVVSGVKGVDHIPQEELSPFRQEGGQAVQGARLLRAPLRRLPPRWCR